METTFSEIIDLNEDKTFSYKDIQKDISLSMEDLSENGGINYDTFLKYVNEFEKREFNALKEVKEENKNIINYCERNIYYIGNVIYVSINEEVIYMTFNEMTKMVNEFFKIISRIKNAIGDPITIKMRFDSDIFYNHTMIYFTNFCSFIFILKSMISFDSFSMVISTRSVSSGLLYLAFCVDLFDEIEIEVDELLFEISCKSSIVSNDSFDSLNRKFTVRLIDELIEHGLLSEEDRVTNDDPISIIKRVFLNRGESTNE